MRRLTILFIVAAACSPGGGITTVDGTAAPPATSAPGSGSITVPPTVVTTTTLPPRPALSKAQVVYFLIDSAGRQTLVPVWRAETSPQGVKGAIETLLAGPSPVESLGVPSVSSDVPVEAVLLGATVVNGLATVDFTASFYDSDVLPMGRMAQVVYTATRFDEVESVSFRIDGEPFTGLPSPLDRTAFADLVGPLFIEEPPYGGPADQPGRLSGQASTGSFSVRITNAAGLEVASFPVDVAAGQRVPFDVALPYFVSFDQNGLIFFSTADGAGNQTYPLQLLLPPAGVCSAVGLAPVAIDQGLPAAVAEKRQAIINAATSCDLDALATLGSDEFTFSFGGGNDAAAFWRSEEAAGIPVTRLMVQLLNTPPVLDPDFFEPTYLWPAAFRAAPSPEDFDLLEGILPGADLELYRQFNEYLDLRLGITTSGSWDFAVTGD